MSSLDDVIKAACRIVDADDTLAGSGVVVMPGAYVLTCHHVVRGLREIRVIANGASESIPAQYDAQRSAAERDIAVLVVPGLDAPPVQLGSLRVGVDAAGVGFRPKELMAEPRGHVFSGKLTLGQELRLAPDPLPNTLAVLPAAERPAWAREPAEYHVSDVANLAVPGGLEPGISGGPVFDTSARRVVGLFRAIEGSGQAYVLPLELLSATGEDLLESNRLEVSDTALDALHDRYGIGLVREGAQPQRPQPWRQFDRFLKQHRLFAGRMDEMARLDRSIADSECDYLLVTGISGFGKTALLVNWALRLHDQNHAVVVHFITSRVDDALTARDVLGSLCRQLLSIHQLGGDLPSFDGDLRHLLADLLQFEPSDAAGLVVIVDGLDEPIGIWNPDGLWPSPLPPGVHVVLSARTIADIDWIERLGLNAQATQGIELDRLTRDEICQLVEGIPGLDAEIAGQVATVSEGDPFYVRDIVDDLVRAHGETIPKLAEYPIGHVQYLRDWWMEARASNPGPGFEDLMGIMAVAHAPLGEKELARIAPDDALTGTDLAGLIEAARRYLEGSGSDGYRLAHQRIENFLRDTMVDKIGAYHRRMTTFCLREPDVTSSERERHYALRYAVTHLLDEKRSDDAYELVSAQWIARHFSETGSYRLLIDQFGELAAYIGVNGSALERGALVAPLIGARETARDLIATIPADLLVAWTHLGGAEQVLGVCDALGAHRGEAAEPLIAAGGALLSLPDSQMAAGASQLLARAIGMLPFIRTGAWLLERLDELADAARRASPDVRTSLVDQLASVAEAMPSTTSQALTLAHAAAAAAFLGDVARAGNLLADAREVNTTVEREGDALLAHLILLPAVRVVEPEMLRETVQMALSAIRTKPQSSLEDDLAARFVGCWQPERDDWAQEVLDAADEVPLAALCHASDDARTRTIAEAAERLSKDDWETTLAVIAAGPVLRELGTPAAEELLRMALNAPRVARSMVAEGYALLGDWERAFALVEPIDALNASLPHDLALHVKDRAIAMRLVQAAAELDGQELAQLEATLARRLAELDRDASNGLLRSALRRLLAILPEGDTDLLRILTAIAHSDAGEHEAAEHVAARLESPTSEIRAFCGIIDSSLEHPRAPLDRWAAIVRSRLEDWSEETGRTYAAAQAMRCAESLTARMPTAAGALYQATEQALLADEDLSVGLLASLGVAWWRLDRANGVRVLGLAADRVRSEHKHVPAYLAALEGLPPEEVEAQVRNLGSSLDESAQLDRAAFEAEAARVAALARFDRTEALTGTRHLVGMIPEVLRGEYESPNAKASILFGLLEDLTGRSTSDVPYVARAAAEAIAALADMGCPEAPELAKSLVETTLDAAGTGRLRFETLQGLCAGLGVSKSTSVELGTWLPSILTEEERELAVEAFARTGSFDAAENLAFGLQDEERLLERVAASRELAEYKPSGAIEVVLAAEVGPELVRAVVETMHTGASDEALDGVLETLLGADFQGPRYQVVNLLAPLMVPPLLETVGASALDRMLDSFDELDDSFREAANLVAAL